MIKGWGDGRESCGRAARGEEETRGGEARRGEARGGEEHVRQLLQVLPMLLPTPPLCTSLLL